MSEALCLIIGLLLGGIICTVSICCLQMRRVSRYEQEIRQLKEKINKQD